MSRIELNGSKYNVEIEGNGPAILLVHGFTGSASTWKTSRDYLSGMTTIAPDLLGHGDSDCPPERDRHSMPAAVDDLVCLIRKLSFGRVIVLGYSMGGRLAMHLALRAPEIVEALVLESTSAGIESRQERLARATSDEQLADEIERDGIAAFVARWEALPLFASQVNLPAAARESLRRQRLKQSPHGLASSLRGMSVGFQESLWTRLSELSMPELIIAGALDRKYCDIARTMSEAVPDARLSIIPDAGHAVHLERPSAFWQTVRTFLADLTPEKERRLV